MSNTENQVRAALPRDKLRQNVLRSTNIGPAKVPAPTEVVDIESPTAALELANPFAAMIKVGTLGKRKFSEIRDSIDATYDTFDKLKSELLDKQKETEDEIKIIETRRQFFTDPDLMSNTDTSLVPLRETLSAIKAQLERITRPRKE